MMGREIVNSMAGMNAANRRFWNNIKAAQQATLSRAAEINQEVSRKKIEDFGTKYTGALISSIKPEKKDNNTVLVLASDYSKTGPEHAEIEMGLKASGLPSGERRNFSEYPGLREWAEFRFGEFKGNSIWVGGPNSLVHPDGLHYMEEGAAIAAANVPAILDMEIKKMTG